MRVTTSQHNFVAGKSACTTRPGPASKHQDRPASHGCPGCTVSCKSAYASIAFSLPGPPIKNCHTPKKCHTLKGVACYRPLVQIGGGVRGCSAMALVSPVVDHTSEVRLIDTGLISTSPHHLFSRQEPHSAKLDPPLGTTGTATPLKWNPRRRIHPQTFLL